MLKPSDTFKLDKNKDSVDWQNLLILSVYDRFPDPVVIFDQDHSMRYVNAAFSKLLKFDAREVIGTIPPFNFLNVDRSSKKLASYDVSRAIRFQCPVKGKDGHTFWIEVMSSPLIDNNICGALTIWHDISELKESQVFNSTLLENAPNPILVSNFDTSIVYANPALEKLTGFTLKELKGLKIPYPWWPKEQTSVYSGITRRPSRFRAERQAVTKSGKYFWIDISFATIETQGEKRYRISNWVDVTERKKLEEHINKLYQKEKQQVQELEEEARLRGMFINVLAHELRTPITPILASSSSLIALLQNKKENLAKRLAQNINSSADILAKRLEELLDMARYARGAFQLNIQPVELKLFFEQVVERFKPTLRSDQTLNPIIPRNLPTGHIDASRIEQVVINLLSNAVKFNRGGGVITIKVDVCDENLCVEIQDQGIGISAEAQKKLFQPYYRVDQDQHQFQGLGLGLAVSKQIVEAHKGKIWVTSKMGRGSIFSFQIPVKIDG